MLFTYREFIAGSWDWCSEKELGQGEGRGREKERGVEVEVMSVAY